MGQICDLPKLVEEYCLTLSQKCPASVRTIDGAVFLKRDAIVILLRRMLQLRQSKKLVLGDTDCAKLN